MEGEVEKCVARQRLMLAETPCMDDHRRKTGNGLCADWRKCLYLLRIGRRHCPHAETFSNKAEQSLCQRVDTIDKLHQTFRTLQTRLVCLGKMRMAKFRCVWTHLWQESGMMPKRRQAECHVDWDHKHSFQSLGCARSKPTFLTAVPSL